MGSKTIINVSSNVHKLIYKKGVIQGLEPPRAADLGVALALALCERPSLDSAREGRDLPGLLGRARMLLGHMVQLLAPCSCQLVEGAGVHGGADAVADHGAPIGLDEHES